MKFLICALVMLTSFMTLKMFKDELYDLLNMGRKVIPNTIFYSGFIIASFFNYKLYNALEKEETIKAAEKVVSHSIHKIKIISIEPPKHHVITFKDLETGVVTVFPMGRYCFYGKVKAGKTYDIKATVRNNPMKSKDNYIVYENTYDVLCPEN